MGSDRTEANGQGPPALRVDLPLRLRAPQERRDPLAHPAQGQRGSVLLGPRTFRQGSRSGQEETHPARARSSRLAHRKEEATGPRRDTAGVLTLTLAGATALRKALAAFRRGGGQPPLRGD